MKHICVLASAVVAVGLGGSILGCGGRGQQLKTSPVQVRCAAGANPASVTPESVTVAVGDSVRWRMTGPVVSDSINIVLKPGQRGQWPFAGPPPHGDSVATAADARTPGQYRYLVALWCRVPGGAIQPDTIDPDIIIE